MSKVDYAIFENGVFRPTEPVDWSAATWRQKHPRRRLRPNPNDRHWIVCGSHGYTVDEDKMERHEILSPAINWPNLVRHVVEDQVVVELADGHVPVARLVPIGKPKTWADLDDALRQLPFLGDDAESFEADIQELRSSMKPLDDPWES